MATIAIHTDNHRLPVHPTCQVSPSTNHCAHVAVVLCLHLSGTTVVWIGHLWLRVHAPKLRNDDQNSEIALFEMVHWTSQHCSSTSAHLFTLGVGMIEQVLVGRSFG